MILLAHLMLIQIILLLNYYAFYFILNSLISTATLIMRGDSHFNIENCNRPSLLLKLFLKSDFKLYFLTQDFDGNTCIWVT